MKKSAAQRDRRVASAGRRDWELLVRDGTVPRRANKGPGRRTLPLPKATVEQYVVAFCKAPLTRKAVMDLSAMLAQVVGSQLRPELPGVNVEVGHRAFGGSVRRHHLDAFVANARLGLQMGIDVKGLNSPESVAKNWNNRVGDLHELAANHHLSFPRAVMGGVLAIPYEGISERTLANIERAMMNINGRRAVANTNNVLEVASLLVISKANRQIVDAIPDPNGPLRFEKFAQQMAEVFKQRQG